MNKKYYLIKIDSYEDYYKATFVMKAENEKKIEKYLNEKMASDQYIVSIEEVDFENNKEEILKHVNYEKKMYSLYKEI